MQYVVKLKSESVTVSEANETIQFFIIFLTEGREVLDVRCHLVDFTRLHIMDYYITIVLWRYVVSEIKQQLNTS